MDWRGLAAFPAIELNKSDGLSKDAASVLGTFQLVCSSRKWKAARKLGIANGNWQPSVQALALPQLQALLQTVHPSTLQSSCILDVMILHLNLLDQEVDMAFMQVRHLLI